MIVKDFHRYVLRGCCMSLLVSALLIVICSLALLDLYRLPTASARIVSFFVFSWAHLVVVAQTLGALSLLRPLPYLGLQLVLTAICLGVWVAARRLQIPSYPVHLRVQIGALPSYLKGLMREARAYPLLVIFTGGVIVAALLWAIQFLAVAPNSYDAKHYHLPRVGYWIQHENLLPWITPNERQTAFPVVSSLGVLWVALFDETEQLFASFQWIAALIAMPAIYGISRLIGASRAQGWFGMLFWASLPNIALLASSTLNDLLMAAFVVIGVYLLFLGIQNKSTATLIVSGLSFGLAFGTKSTAFFLVPGLGLSAIAILLVAPRRHFRMMVTWSAAGIIGVLVLGSFVYFTNWAYYGNPLGSEQLVGAHINNRDVSRLTMLAHNTFRYGYLFIDPEGLPEPIAQPIRAARTYVIGGIANRLGLDLNSPYTRHTGQEWEFGITHSGFGESRRWYGIFGILLIVPGIAAGLWFALRRRDAFRLTLVLIPVLFAIAQFTLEPFSINIARYFTSAVVLTIPLVAVLLPTRWLRGLRPTIIIVIALYLLFNSTLYNTQRAFSTRQPFWQQTYIQQMTSRSVETEARMSAVVDCVPLDGMLGVMYFPTNTEEYIYFGQGFSRTLIQFVPIPNSMMTMPTFDEHPEIAFIIANDETAGYIPSDFSSLRDAGTYGLYIRKSMADQALCEPDATIDAG